MTHKDKYIRDGEATSKYNKRYYHEHRKKLLARANHRTLVNPNYNKMYYALHKEQVKERNKKYYKEHKEEVKDETNHERFKGNKDAEGTREGKRRVS